LRPLNASDSRTAAFIDQYLASKGSPAAGRGFGEMAVRYGRQYNVDPLLLTAIGGHETVYGKRGVGVRGMLGVGAYDHNPRNAVNNPRFSGIERQLAVGARTFARLRRRGGAGPQDSIARQLWAANRGGWATDPNWHRGVARHYRQITGAARAAGL
jgi:hypothetical protein